MDARTFLVCTVTKTGMSHFPHAGTMLSVAGIAGYIVGILAPYPGRSLSIAGIMAGVTLTAIGRWGTSEVVTG